MPTRLGLVSRIDAEALKVASRIVQFLRKKRVEVVPEEKTAKALGLHHGMELRKMRAEAIISVGGDGTVLRTHLELSRPETPLIAINMGKRGYLSEVRPRGAIRAIQQYLDGKHRLEDHMKVSISVDGEYFHDGLNEGLVCASKPMKMLNLKVSISGQPLIQRWADGVIVATPTGSTAHSYSAGGPILQGEVKALAVVFLSPLREPRSVVVPSKSSVEVGVLESKSLPKLVVDGNLEREFGARQKIIFTESKHKARFVRFGSLFLEKSIERLASPERVID